MHLNTPNLDQLPATDAERQMAEKHTRIRPVAVEGHPDAHSAWLVVGSQQFQVGDWWETEEDAVWICWQLAKALILVASG